MISRELILDVDREPLLDDILLEQLWQKMLDMFCLKYEVILFSNTRAYEVNDVVVYNQKLFVCKTSITENLQTAHTPDPTQDTTYWARVFI